MSIQFLVLCLTVGIILSTGLTNAGSSVVGVIKCTTGPTNTYQWNGRIYPKLNTISTVWGDVDEQNFTKVLPLSTARWTFVWTRNDEIGEEEIFDLIVATKFPAPSNQELNCITIQFHPKVKGTKIEGPLMIEVKMLVSNTEWLEGVLHPVQSRTLAGYLESSTKMFFKDKTSKLANFKAACEKQEYVQSTVYNVGDHKLSSILLPLLGYVVPQLDRLDKPTGISTFTMEIPLGITLTIGNTVYEGAACLNRGQIKLCISKNQAEALEKWFKLQRTAVICSGSLREQNGNPDIYCNVNLHNLEMKTNSSTVPKLSGKVVKLLEFEYTTEA